MKFNIASLLLRVTLPLASGCGRNDTEINSAYNLTSKVNLGAQNRLALQSNESTYRYILPEPETLEDPDASNLPIATHTPLTKATPPPIELHFQIAHNSQ